MKYYSKKTRKLKKKMIKYHGKDDIDTSQMDRIERLRRKRDTPLARGGKIERSHKKRVGNAVNRNIDKRYNTAEKVIQRISGKKLKEEWLDTVKSDLGNIYEVFVNPSQSEITKLVNTTSGYLRYAIDGKKKKFYVFSGNTSHKQILPKIKVPYKYTNKNYMYGDTDEMKPGQKVQIKYYDTHDLAEFIEANEDTDWIWEYLDKTSYLKEKDRKE